MVAQLGRTSNERTSSGSIRNPIQDRQASIIDFMLNMNGKFNGVSGLVFVSSNNDGVLSCAICDLVGA